MYTKTNQNPLQKYILIYEVPSDNQISSSFLGRICPNRSSVPLVLVHGSASRAEKCTFPSNALPNSYTRPLNHRATTSRPRNHLSPAQPPLNHRATTSAALQPRPTYKKQKRRPRRPPPIIISVLIRRAYSSASPIFPTTTATAAQAATATTAMAANFANAFILLPPCSFDFLHPSCAGTNRAAPGPTELPGTHRTARDPPASSHTSDTSYTKAAGQTVVISSAASLLYHGLIVPHVREDVSKLMSAN